MKTIARFLLLLLFGLGVLVNLGGAMADFRTHNWFWFFPEVFTTVALILLIRNSGEGATLGQLATGGALLAAFWASMVWVIRPVAELLMTLWEALPALWHEYLNLPWWAIALSVVLAPAILGLAYQLLILWPLGLLACLVSATIGSVWPRREPKA